MKAEVTNKLGISEVAQGTSNPLATYSGILKYCERGITCLHNQRKVIKIDSKIYTTVNDGFAGSSVEGHKYIKRR